MISYAVGGHCEKVRLQKVEQCGFEGDQPVRRVSLCARFTRMGDARRVEEGARPESVFGVVRCEDGAEELDTRLPHCCDWIRSVRQRHVPHLSLCQGGLGGMLQFINSAYLYLFVVLISPHPALEVEAARMDHLQILDSLLKKDYDRRATPTNHLNNATTVHCELYIRSFGSISPVTMDYEVDLYLRQKWQDERLKHAQITESLDLNDPNLVKAIWKPEVYFPNAKHAEFQFVTVPNVLVRINPDGEILYMLRLKLTFSCMMDLSKFPLDSQTCTMEVASFSKTIEELRLEWKAENSVIMAKELRMPQFEIVRIIASNCQESFQIGNYSCLVAEFYLSRSVGFHLVQSYLPTILIVVISWVSFWMDVNSVPGRTTLGVTTLLAVSSQSSGIQSGLPQVSYVKAIDVWMGTCTAFVFCALLEFTLVNYMWRKQPSSRPYNPSRGSLINGGEVLKRSASAGLIRRPASEQKICTTTEVDISNTGVETRPIRSANAKKRERQSRQMLARKIDERARLAFPVAFALFNVSYWMYYLN